MGKITTLINLLATVMFIVINLPGIVLPILFVITILLPNAFDYFVLRVGMYALFAITFLAILKYSIPPTYRTYKLSRIYPIYRELLDTHLAHNWPIALYLLCAQFMISFLFGFDIDLVPNTKLFPQIGFIPAEAQYSLYSFFWIGLYMILIRLRLSGQKKSPTEFQDKNI